jgi:hypothetical protein
MSRGKPLTLSARGVRQLVPLALGIVAAIPAAVTVSPDRPRLILESAIPSDLPVAMR